jgi:hypothetical protein
LEESARRGANQTELRSFSNVVRILIPGVRIFFGRMRPARRDLLWKKLLTIRSHTAVARARDNNMGADDTGSRPSVGAGRTGGQV